MQDTSQSRILSTQKECMSSKRRKLSHGSDASSVMGPAQGQPQESPSAQECCPICLQDITDAALTHPCNHLFDFECVRRWVDQSNSCPLCKTSVTTLIHDIDKAAFKRYECPPIVTPGIQSIGALRRRRREQEQERRFQRRSWVQRQHLESSDLQCESDIALKRRKFVYRHHLYSSHVGTNTTSNFMAFNMMDIRNNTRNLKSKASMFLRRELQVFTFLTDNVEFTLQYIVDGVLTRMEVQAPGTVELVGDLIGSENAQLLLHELRTFLRSPFQVLSGFDRSSLIQYTKVLEPAWHDDVVNVVVATHDK